MEGVIMTTTDIYRIKTMNSVYEIHVNDHGRSRCRKEFGEWEYVRSTTPDYLEKLYIGASLDVPGVVLTSVVKDYAHFQPVAEEKRTVENITTIGGFFQGLVEHVKEQAAPQAVMVMQAQVEANRDAGCSEDCPGKNSPAWHNGSKGCQSGSIASGGTRAHCTCDRCY